MTANPQMDFTLGEEQAELQKLGEKIFSELVTPKALQEEEAGDWVHGRLCSGLARAGLVGPGPPGGPGGGVPERGREWRGPRGSAGGSGGGGSYAGKTDRHHGRAAPADHARKRARAGRGSARRRRAGRGDRALRRRAHAGGAGGDGA